MLYTHATGFGGSWQLSIWRDDGVGKDLCQRILAAQGPDGELATRHLEKYQRPIQPTPYTRVTAYWSPDGQTGHCR
jgi:hypothetical protein